MLFITFEGPEGGGKTTQIQRLALALTKRGRAVIRTREPGGGPVGEQVRALALSGDPTAETELLLMAAARAQNVATVVRPALESGQIVLCDRFTDSTIAYQGYGRGLPREIIDTLNRFATGGLTPSRTFLLDLPPEIGLARQRPEEQNRLDQETLAFHERVRRGFLEIAQSAPERIRRLDATLPEAVVAEQIERAVSELLIAHDGTVHGRTARGD